MAEKIDNWAEKRKEYLLVAVLCFIVGLYSFIKVKSDGYTIKQSHLKVIANLIISDKPNFQETKGKHGRKWIEFKCVDNK